MKPSTHDSYLLHGKTIMRKILSSMHNQQAMIKTNYDLLLATLTCLAACKPATLVGQT
jgi:hypothetical protein